jgi:NAD(P)-dependent dehydrogenase (short-subunit alcohol dehydrogenase family)
MPGNANPVVLITGGTGGIGLAIALRMAKLGATTVIVGRDKGRGQAAVAEIQTQSRGGAVELMLADLSSQRAVHLLAAEFMNRHARLDVLINNAGGLYGKRWETVDGIEGTLALNHLCPFLLTHLLLPVLRTGAPSRIVNVNSEGHRAAKTVNFRDFDAARWRWGFLIYSQTKLANLLFTYEMARRLNASGITVNAVHPGIVDTQLFRRFIEERFTLIGGVLSKAAAFIARKVAYRISHFDTVEDAAECPVYLASSCEVADITGKYFNSNKKMVESSPPSHDDALSREVWRVSAEMVGLAGNEASQVQRRFA